MNDFKSQYMNESVRVWNCYCGKSGCPEELIDDRDVDRFHPKNKGLGPHDRLFVSHYKLCPKCKRVIFQDGQYIAI